MWLKKLVRCDTFGVIISIFLSDAAKAAPNKLKDSWPLPALLFFHGLQSVLKLFIKKKSVLKLHGAQFGIILFKKNYRMMMTPRHTILKNTSNSTIIEYAICYHVSLSKGLHQSGAKHAKD